MGPEKEIPYQSDRCTTCSSQKGTTLQIAARCIVCHAQPRIEPHGGFLLGLSADQDGLAGIQKPSGCCAMLTEVAELCFGYSVCTQIVPRTIV